MATELGCHCSPVICVVTQWNKIHTRNNPKIPQDTFWGVILPGIYNQIFTYTVMIVMLNSVLGNQQMKKKTN